MKMYEVDFEFSAFSTTSRFVGILAAVRNTILEWTTRLEAEGIIGEGMTFSEQEKHKAADAGQNIQINTFHGVLGNVQGEQVQIGDFATIHGAIKEAGVSQEERNKLENLLDELKIASADKKPSIVKQGVQWVVNNGEKLGKLATVIRGWFE